MLLVNFLLIDVISSFTAFVILISGVASISRLAILSTVFFDISVNSDPESISVFTG